MTELDAAKKSLACLAVQVPEEVYDDVMKKLIPVVQMAEKWKRVSDENEWLRGELEKIVKTKGQWETRSKTMRYIAQEALRPNVRQAQDPKEKHD